MIEMARQLTIARAVHAAMAVPMAEALVFAQRALRVPCLASSRITVPLTDDDDAALSIDVYRRLVCRRLASFYVRLADLRESFAPRVGGRPRSRHVSARRAAEDWGLDLSLIRDNLGKTATERIRQLDAMGRFTRGIRRAGSWCMHHVR